MSKAKIASKKNKIKFALCIGDKEIIPVKFISETASYMAAEYKDNGDLVFGESREVLHWSAAKEVAELKPVK